MITFIPTSHGNLTMNIPLGTNIVLADELYYYVKATFIIEEETTLRKLLNTNPKDKQLHHFAKQLGYTK